MRTPLSTHRITNSYANSQKTREAEEITHAQIRGCLNNAMYNMSSSIYPLVPPLPLRPYHAQKVTESLAIWLAGWRAPGLECKLPTSWLLPVVTANQNERVITKSNG